MRIIHSSDVHLGKSFTFLDDETAPLMREARFAVLSRLGELAVEHNARHVLLAGDTFDAVQIGNATLDRAIDIMRRHDRLLWHMIPGNHDFHQPHGLWDRVARKGLPSNIQIHLERAPVPLKGEHSPAWLLPAPLFHLGAPDDPTGWMNDAATPEGALRIGLAHGGILSFGEDETAPIPPDRAAHAGLDYLALGDWHRRIKVNVHTCYSGTPEPDAFKRSGDNDTRCNGGEALLVELPGPGATPEVSPLLTASYVWHQIKTRLNEQVDVDALADRLEGLGRPERLLVDLTLEGVLSLAARNVVEDRIVERLGAALRWLRVCDQRLVLEPDEADLATMGEGGLIHAAGERLQRMIHGAEPEQARIAQLALKTLYLEHLRAGA